MIRTDVNIEVIRRIIMWSTTLESQLVGSNPLLTSDGAAVVACHVHFDAMVDGLSWKVGGKSPERPVDSRRLELPHSTAPDADRVVMTMTNTLMRSPSILETLQTTPALRKNLMVRYSVALPTEGGSSLSVSVVMPSYIFSRSLAIAFLGAVALWPPFSSVAIRFVS